MKRFSPGGDRYIAVEFYRGARVFDPVYAKTLTTARGHFLIDKLRNFHPLNNDELIRALKLSFISYKTNALQLAREKVDMKRIADTANLLSFILTVNVQNDWECGGRQRVW